MLPKSLWKSTSLFLPLPLKRNSIQATSACTVVSAIQLFYNLWWLNKAMTVVQCTLVAVYTLDTPGYKHTVWSCGCCLLH